METLDIIIPTYNRSAMLQSCVESILAARCKGLEWRITVVDNNSQDDTERVVRSLMERHGARVRYLRESQQGRSAALNCGIRASECSLIAMIDDDEQICGHWLEVIERTFRDKQVSYISGPCLSLWQISRPNWLPKGYDGVLSADDPEKLPNRTLPFGGRDLFPRGGNAVFRHSVFERVGLYDTGLGRTGSNLASCEDHDMYCRLSDAKIAGIYVPALIVYHAIPPERLTRRYFRRWVWGHAISLAQMNDKSPERVAYLGRIPRHRVGHAVRSLPKLANPDPGVRFSAELHWRALLGFAYGAYLRRDLVQPRP